MSCYMCHVMCVRQHSLTHVSYHVLPCVYISCRPLFLHLTSSYIFLQLCVSYSSMCLTSCLFISSYIGLFSYHMSSMLVSFHTCRLLLRPTRLVQQEACRASYCQIKFLYFSQFQWVCRSGCCLSKSQLDCISSFFRPGMHGSVMWAVS